jgi:hypothetical protein
VSKASADEVRQLIRLVQPDVVLLELDEGRAARLQSGESASMLGFLRVGVPVGRRPPSWLDDLLAPRDLKLLYKICELISNLYLAQRCVCDAEYPAGRADTWQAVGRECHQVGRWWHVGNVQHQSHKSRAIVRID